MTAINCMNEQQSWQWQEWQGLPYLTCDLLQDWKHGFFTQQCAPRLPEELTMALASSAKVYRVKQVHGNVVLTPQEIANAPKAETATFPDADGVITENSAQSIWVASADCNPVLIGDRTTGRAAAVHAGWRGTAQQIVPEAIKRFQTEGSKLVDLVVAIGPAIAGRVYQVSETVAAEVGKSIVSQTNKAEILQALFALPDSPILPDKQSGRVRLDVRKVNQIQLLHLGFSESQISVAPYCTYQDQDYFFSYRRTKLKKVQWSGIVSH